MTHQGTSETSTHTREVDTMKAREAVNAYAAVGFETYTPDQYVREIGAFEGHAAWTWACGADLVQYKYAGLCGTRYEMVPNGYQLSSYTGNSAIKSSLWGCIHADIRIYPEVFV